MAKWLFAVVLLLGSCAADYDAAIREKASVDLGCRSSEVKILRRIKPEDYRRLYLLKCGQLYCWYDCKQIASCSAVVHCRQRSQPTKKDPCAS